jgi:ketosteroid isomerase-like protein
LSRENVETLKRSNAAFNRGDREAALAAYHPDVELRDLQPAPDSPELLVGRSAVDAYWAQWEDAFDELTAEMEEYIDLGDHVVTVTHWRARGKGTALPVDLRTADVFEFAGGTIIRATLSYTSRDKALEAVGTQHAVSQEPAAPDPAEVTRRQIAAVNGRDFDAMLPYAAPDLVYDTSPSGFGSYEGIAAIREFIESYWKTFDELTFELEEFTDLGHGVTFAVNRQRALPAGSSAPVEAREAHVTEWKDGLAVRITVYRDVEEGRAAAERLVASRR